MVIVAQQSSYRRMKGSASGYDSRVFWLSNENPSLGTCHKMSATHPKQAVIAALPVRHGGGVFTTKQGAHECFDTQRVGCGSLDGSESVVHNERHNYGCVIPRRK